VAEWIQASLFEDLAQNGARRETVPDSLGGARRTLSGVNYFFGLTTTISPDQRQLLCSSKARGEAPRPSGFSLSSQK
jgi:hypothetical protein